MIDNPTPVEQARAARWVTDWITRKIQATEDWVDVADVAGDIMYMLRKHADAMDPLGIGVDELSTGFDAERVLRLPRATEVDGPADARIGGESTEPAPSPPVTRTTEMSTEVTSESLRTHARWAQERGKSYTHTAIDLDDLATLVEREQRPLPERPGWYELIVVERLNEEGEKESCTGAFRDTSGDWHTPDFAVNEASPNVTIRWAEQSGTTPGQTLWELTTEEFGGALSTNWRGATSAFKSWHENVATAILAAHGTPTLAPVDHHPEPGTRGLLPVVVLDNGGWETPDGWVVHCPVPTVLADPRPDGAL